MPSKALRGLAATAEQPHFDGPNRPHTKAETNSGRESRQGQPGIRVAP